MSSSKTINLITSRSAAVAQSNNNNNDEDQNSSKTNAFAITENDLSALHNYGCWCHFGEQFGKGLPVDQYDKECKILQEGYECLKLDNDACDIWNIEYNSVTNGVSKFNGDENENIKNACLTANNNNYCESRLCMIEGRFLTNLMDLIFEQKIRPNFKDFSLQKGFFEYDLYCQVNSRSINSDSEKSCCGEYPNRFPFKTYGGQRGCCGNKTFAAEFKICCEDGVPRMTCA